MFIEKFRKFVCDGDSISCVVDGFDCKATIYCDEINDAPWERYDGFWPSLNPDDAGYIGPKSKRALAYALVKAENVKRAWENGEWWYVGVAVTISKNGIELTGKFAHAVWGVECNYPGNNNDCLREIANEELPDALQDAREVITKLAEMTHE